MSTVPSVIQGRGCAAGEFVGEIVVSNQPFQ